MLFGRTKKNPITLADNGVVEWKYATCGYCSTGCSIEVGLNADGKPVASRGVADADVNQGKLCVKGLVEHRLFESAGRGTRPMTRKHWHDPWQPTDWDTALDKVHDEIRRCRSQRRPRASTLGRDLRKVRVSSGAPLVRRFPRRRPILCTR